MRKKYIWCSWIVGAPFYFITSMMSRNVQKQKKRKICSLISLSVCEFITAGMVQKMKNTCGFIFQPSSPTSLSNCISHPALPYQSIQNNILYLNKQRFPNVVSLSQFQQSTTKVHPQTQYICIIVRQSAWSG